MKIEGVRRTWVGGLVVCTLAMLVLSADLAAELKKVAIVDLQLGINSTNKGVKIKEILKKEMEAKQKELEKEQAELEEMRKKLEVQSSTYSPEVLKAKSLDFQKKVQAFMMKRESTRNEFADKEMKHTQDIIDDLRVVIQDIAQAEKFDAVFEKKESGILYIREVTDITNKVIEAYNKKFK